MNNRLIVRCLGRLLLSLERMVSSSYRRQVQYPELQANRSLFMLNIVGNMERALQGLGELSRFVPTSSKLQIGLHILECNSP